MLHLWTVLTSQNYTFNVREWSRVFYAISFVIEEKRSFKMGRGRKNSFLKCVKISNRKFLIDKSKFNSKALSDLHKYSESGVFLPVISSKTPSISFQKGTKITETPSKRFPQKSASRENHIRDTFSNQKDDHPNKYTKKQENNKTKINVFRLNLDYKFDTLFSFHIFLFLAAFLLCWSFVEFIINYVKNSLIHHIFRWNHDKIYLRSRLDRGKLTTN